MQGRRIDFRPGFPREGQAGDYCKVPDGLDPREDGCWYCIDPSGGAGAILASLHAVEEHADGSITVSPSLVMPGGWHGFLRAGVWSAC